MVTLKTYLLLLRRYGLVILSYSALFLMLILLMGKEAQPTVTLEPSRIEAALILPDAAHAEGEAFANWLQAKGHRVDRVTLSVEEAREAVFGHRYEAVYFFEATDPYPLVITDRASAGGHFGLSLAERYFRYRDALVDAEGEVDREVLETILNQSVDVSILSGGEDTADRQARLSLLSAFAYILLLMSTTLVPLVSQPFLAPQLRGRTSLSPLPAHRQTAELALGSGLVVVGAAFVLLAATLPVTRALFSGETAFPVLLNCLIFTLTTLSLSVLLAGLIRHKAAITAISTVLSLGMAFLSGAFVPQALMGKAALTIARGFPLFYFIRANRRIGEGQAFGGDFAAQLLFAVAYFILALTAARWARRPRGQSV